MWAIRHQAEPLGHLHRQPRRGCLMRIGFDSRGPTCARTVSHPIAAVCHADVKLSGSRARTCSTSRGISAPCYEAYPAHVHEKGTEEPGGPIVLKWTTMRLGNRRRASAPVSKCSSAAQPSQRAGASKCASLAHFARRQERPEPE